jgi:hypothetical protein
MTDLKTLVEGYVKPNRNRGVDRNAESYMQCAEFTKQELERLVNLYRSTVFLEDMRARLIRDSIDHHIRRYHGYAVQGKIGSHYREVGVIESQSIFEHVIPASSVRDMLLEGRLTINQALNTPTCLIKKSQDAKLSKNGLSKTSPNNWCFFQRYRILDSQFTTNTGIPITDLDTWTLQDHHDYFQIT